MRNYNIGVVLSNNWMCLWTPEFEQNERLARVRKKVRPCSLAMCCFNLVIMHCLLDHTAVICLLISLPFMEGWVVWIPRNGIQCLISMHRLPTSYIRGNILYYFLLVVAKWVLLLFKDRTKWYWSCSDSVNFCLCWNSFWNYPYIEWDGKIGILTFLNEILQLEHKGIGEEGIKEE